MDVLNSCTDIATCIKSGTPTIGEIAATYGRTFCRGYIKTWIIDLREFLNLKGAMSDTQTDMTAEMIVSEYRNITVADINLIFRNAKFGRYGEFYGRLDGQMILGWFDKYFNERCDVAAEISISEAHSMKTRDCDTPARLQKMIDAAMSRKPF